MNEAMSDLGQQSEAFVDTCDLQKAMTSNEVTTKPKDDDQLKDLAIGLPFLATPAPLLGPFAVEKVCEMDPVLCSGPKMTYLRSLFNAVKKLLPKSNVLRGLPENESTSKIDVSSLGSESDGELETGKTPLFQDSAKAGKYNKHRLNKIPEECEDENCAHEHDSEHPDGEEPEETPASDSEPIKPKPESLYRCERYNPKTQRLEQYTLREITEQNIIKEF